MRLAGKSVVITGAGSGIGRAMAGLFAAEGGRIVAADWHAAALAEVVAEVTSAGGAITGVQGDVSQEADCLRIIDTATSMYGGIDVLCNNAGVMDTNHGVGELTDEMWQRVLGINLYGPMYLSRKAVPLRVGQGHGSIINTASMSSIGGGAAGCAYTVSKHGLIGLTRSTAFLYAQDGLRCNAIVVGAVGQTNIMSSVDTSKMDAKASARIGTWLAAIPRVLDPMTVARMALFLASDESLGVNGALLPVDAGWSAA
jgi:NAD(P)-dependent dehydrogenase (short-subunit alcohol dehydrogenase family)